MTTTQTAAVLTVHPPDSARGVDEPITIELFDWSATLLHPPGRAEPVLQVGGWTRGVRPPNRHDWIYSGGVSAHLPGRGELPCTPALPDSWYVTSKGSDRDPWVRLWLPAVLDDQLSPDQLFDGGSA